MSLPFLEVVLAIRLHHRQVHVIFIAGPCVVFPWPASLLPFLLLVVIDVPNQETFRWELSIQRDGLSAFNQ
jgi:hypothetical protein